MAKIVEITQQSSVSCKIGGQASAEFSVTNITDGKIPVGVRVIADDADTESWFEPEGGPEWLFEQNENKPINVTIKVPETASEAVRTFCIEVFSAVPMKGGIDFTTGEKMALEVTRSTPPPPPPPFWVWIVLAAVLVLMIAGGTAWYLLAGVPNVKGKPYADAVEMLNEDYPTIVKEIEVDAEGEPGIVIDQDTGEKDEDGIPAVILYVPGVIMPDMAGNSMQQLIDKLIELGMSTKLTERTDNSKPANTVISHTPPGGEAIAKGEVVNVVISKRGSTTRPAWPIKFGTVLTPSKLQGIKREFERPLSDDSGEPRVHGDYVIGEPLGR